MDERVIMQLLIKAMKEIQEKSGEKNQPITPDTIPLKELDGFDSLRAEEVITELEVEVNSEIGGSNLFLSKDGTRLLSIGEVAEKISKTLIHSEA